MHLLCSNYWIQPIYQELLHSSSRYNATRTGERNRPSSGLARVAAHPRPPKKRKPSASGTRFCDWIGGICYADTLQVWFPAHWASVVLQQLQQTEDDYRAAHPSWMDQAEAPADIRKQWREARANRRMQFKVGNYKDGGRESNIRMLTGTIKADWIQLPVERYLEALPTLRRGVIAGVYRNKGAAPWAITRAEKLQLSVFLPNDLSLDDWYAGVYALPTVWPDVSMMGADYLRKVVGYDFHHLRKKYDVLSMWGNIDPQWRLLKSHLETKGPSWYPPSEREQRLFTNRSNRPGDDMKDELRTDGTQWRGKLGILYRTSFYNYANQLRPLSFREKKEFSWTCMLKYEQKNKSSLLNSPALSQKYLWGKERRGSKLKMVPWLGSQAAWASAALLCLVLCFGWPLWVGHLSLHCGFWGWLPCQSISSGMTHQGLASDLWLHCLWTLLPLAYYTWGFASDLVGQSSPGNRSAWIASVQALLLLLDDCYGFTLVACRNSAYRKEWRGIGIIGYQVLKTLWEPAR